MVAFSPTQIPPAISTVEQLKVWCDAILFNQAGADEYLEIENLPREKFINFNVVKVASGETRNIVRSGVQIDPSFIADNSQKFWMFAIEQANTTIPAAFQVD